MRRILPFLLALLMVQGLCTPVFAEEAAPNKQNSLTKSGITIVPDETKSIPDLNEKYQTMIMDAIRAWKQELDLTGLGLQESIVFAFAEMLSDDPELFWLDNCTLTYYTDTGIASKLKFNYHTEFQPSDNQVFTAAVNKALACVLPEMNDLQKVLVLHDYLAAHVAYDHENYLNNTISPVSYTAYGALVLGTAVCQGYSKAYRLLLSRCGIENAYVSSDEMDHGWTMVRLGDNWYHVDVTWDDPTPDNGGGSVEHDYFLLSDKELFGSHYGWAEEQSGVSTRYDEGLFWSSVISPILFMNADIYWFLRETGDYTEQKIQLVRGNWSGGEHVVCATVRDYWPDWNKSGYYWNDAYTGLAYWDYRFFFNDKLHIYAYDPADDTLETVYTYRDREGYLYGLASDGGTIQYLIKQDPNQESGTWRSLALTVKYPPGPFEDVVRGDYAFDAVQWAYDKGVAMGADNGLFLPNSVCNRAQVVTFLWRAAGRPAPISAQNSFADVPENAFYRDAVLWSVEQGITNGTGTDAKTGKQYFSPDANCTYSQILTFIWRWKTGRVTSDHGTWYSEALEWAEKQDVLWKTASSADRVQTEKACPRRDVITYLWRVKTAN